MSIHQDAPLVLAVMAKYFPAPGAPEDYCSNPAEFVRVTSETDGVHVDPELEAKLDQTGRARTPGDVKYIFLTKAGPGPLRQPLEESLLSPETGLPVPPSANHKRLNIGATR